MTLFHPEYGHFPAERARWVAQAMAYRNAKEAYDQLAPPIGYSTLRRWLQRFRDDGFHTGRVSPHEPLDVICTDGELYGGLTWASDRGFFDPITNTPCHRVGLTPIMWRYADDQ